MKISRAVTHQRVRCEMVRVLRYHTRMQRAGWQSLTDGVLLDRLHCGDLFAKKITEVQIDQDGKFLWIRISA